MLAWRNRAAESAGGGSPPPVVEYKCNDFTYEQFGTAFRIMSRAHVSAEEIDQNQALIDYFGPFPREHILVDMANEDADSVSSSDSSARPPLVLRLYLGGPRLR